MGEVIKGGDHAVLVKIFDTGNTKIIPILKGTTVHYGKLHFIPDSLIGSRFGSIFEIVGDQMVPVENFEEFDNELSDVVTNRMMSTFNDKSQFSQEKIIRKRKRQRHANVVTVMKPTLLHINEMLFARDKIGGLRADMLAQILTLSGVQNGSKCLLLDHNHGIVTSAVLSRILPDGVCIQLLPDYETMYTTRKTVSMLNIRETDCTNNLLSITVRDLYKVLKGIDSFDRENDIVQARNEDQLKRLTERLEMLKLKKPDDTKRVKLEDDQDIRVVDQLRNDLIRKDRNREHRNRERKVATELLKQHSLDSLILVVQNDHPLPLLKILLPFIAPSRHFVVYSDILEPLVECHRYVKNNSMAVSVQLSESWLRKHQVLPERTRPEMNVTGCGGFLLSGIKALYGSPNVNLDCDMAVDQASSGKTPLESRESLKIITNDSPTPKRR